MDSPGLRVGGMSGNTDLALAGLGAGTPNRLWTGNRGKPRGRDPGPLQQWRGRQYQRRIKVPHLNLFAFLGHLQQTTLDIQSDDSRITSGLPVIQATKRVNLINDKRRDSTMLSTRDCSFYVW